MAHSMLYYSSKSSKRTAKKQGQQIRENIMKTMKLLATMLISSTSAVYAATSAQSVGAGILSYLFLGFFALIIVSQLVPAVILFAGMMKGLFANQKKASTKIN